MEQQLLQQVEAELAYFASEQRCVHEKRVAALREAEALLDQERRFQGVLDYLAGKRDQLQATVQQQKKDYANMLLSPSSEWQQSQGDVEGHLTET